MGTVISRTKLLLRATYYLHKALLALSKRFKQSPGLPVPNPTLSFWTVPPASVPSSPKLPQYADVVVIGSGITGTSFAYNALKLNGELNIVMLEAREVCSGATGRNGGHVNPPLYEDYPDLKKAFGIETAQKLIRLRLAHLPEFLSIAQEEGITEISQARKTGHFDVYFSKDEYDGIKAYLEEWKKDMPEESKSWVAVDAPEASQKYGLSSAIAGCITGDGGAMHPYRFVTSLQAKLIERHQSFQIATKTPCTSITPSSNKSQPFYTVITPNGSIQTPHIIHTTNGWSSHLLAPMREKIIPARGTMSAQRPGRSLGSRSTLNGLRSYVFNNPSDESMGGFDYLTQLPDGENELMFGGGFLSNLAKGVSEDVGVADDSRYSTFTATHVSGSLPFAFGLENWGREAEGPEEEGGQAGEQVKWGVGRTKAVWSGVLGMSADGQPWVGRLPSKISGRPQPVAAPSKAILQTSPSHEKFGIPSPSQLLGGTSTPISATTTSTTTTTANIHTTPSTTTTTLAKPGEWIAAGYTGEGMPHAWMCAKALAYMVLGREEEIQTWFPENLRVTEERWKKADVVQFIIDRLRR